MGLQNQIFRFGLTKYMWIYFKRPKSTWRVTFLGNRFQFFPILQSEMMIDADLIPLLYNLELISIFFPNSGHRIKLLFGHVCPVQWSYLSLILYGTTKFYSTFLFGLI